MAVLKPVETGSPRIYESLGAKTSWAKLQSIGMVESCREVGEKVQIETRYFLTSLPARGCGSLKPYGSTGALRMRSTGFSMCPFMKMPAGFAKTTGHRLSQCSAILP